MAAAPQQQQQQQPSSSSAAATEQRAPLFTSGVLPVMLRHPDISSSHVTVCRLLCSSRALRSAVLQHASGMLQLRLGYGNRTSQQLCCWLSRHGRLLKALVFDEQLAMADALSLVCALQEAAAAMPGGLQLQVFEAMLPRATAGLVLQPLPPQHLTQLTLTTDHGGAAAQQPDPCVQLAARALAGLTNLSVLWLPCARQGRLGDPALAGTIMPVLSSLTRLTKLYLSGCSKGQLSLLPQQLVELVVSGVAGQPSEQLQLGHLTALTSMLYGPACVQAGDVLPPNLLSLGVGDCSATGPLAALTRLTRLVLERLSASMSVAGLVSSIAGCLQQLQKLWVCYGYEDAAAAAAGPAAVWPALAAGTAAVLPALQELSLDVFPGCMLLGAADAISRLCALTGLTLRADGGEQDVAALDALARAVAGLPRLQALVVDEVEFGRSPASVELLSGATSLTSLTIWAAGLTDHMFSRMFACGRLTGLRSLEVSSDSGLSVPLALMMVVSCLPHLTEFEDSSEVGDGSEADEQCRQQIEAVLEQRRQAAGEG